ncbi:MAG: hypothetical protein AB8G15_22390 [Saprospiraceae bacterium]
MKTIKNIALLICAVLLFANSTFATNPATDPKVAKQELRSEIVQLIKSPIMEGLEEVDAKISFMINDDNEVIVLNVKTASNYIDEFVKKRLNYKAVYTKGLKKNEAYFLKVNFKNPA